ncbi:hypothetical protein EDC96DRAFT_581797 [Choanephora cucurbitarum]|nr:hypothetical protein EDC96DRAFT_581797 [Choanephora cucurbitarum]
MGFRIKGRAQQWHRLNGLTIMSPTTPNKKKVSKSQKTNARFNNWFKNYSTKGCRTLLPPLRTTHNQEELGPFPIRPVQRLEVDASRPIPALRKGYKAIRHADS